MTEGWRGDLGLVSMPPAAHRRWPRPHLLPATETTAGCVCPCCYELKQNFMKLGLSKILLGRKPIRFAQSFFFSSPPSPSSARRLRGSERRLTVAPLGCLRIGLASRRKDRPRACAFLSHMFAQVLLKPALAVSYHRGASFAN